MRNSTPEPSATSVKGFIKDLSEYQHRNPSEPGQAQKPIVNASACNDFPDLKALDKTFGETANSLRDQLRTELAQLQKTHPHHPYWSNQTLYGPVDYGRMETAYTRAIAWLLNGGPNKIWGNEFIEAFVSELVPSQQGDVAIATSETIAEKGDGSGNRIDIYARGTFVDGTTWQFAIEAKIDAVIGHKQLQKYSRFLHKKQREQNFLILLHPSGADLTTETDKFAGNVAFKRMTFSALAQVMGTAYMKLWSAATDSRCELAYARLLIAGLLGDIEQLRLPIDCENPPLALMSR